MRAAPEVPIISATRPRDVQPAPTFEHAPSPSAGRTPATGSSDTGASRPASMPSAASVSSSHASRLGSKRPVPVAVETLVRASPASRRRR